MKRVLAALCLLLLAAGCAGSTASRSGHVDLSGVGHTKYGQ